MVTVRLPGAVDDVVAGGGGRFLVLSLRKLGKVAIFDVNVARVTHYISVSDDNWRMAAGAEKLILALNTKRCCNVGIC
jgi:hypothetical protein